MKLIPKAILFDMDGVLIDSLDSWWLSLNSSLSAYKIKQMTRKEFIDKYWGHDLYDNLKRMNLPPEIGKFCNSIYGTNIGKIKLYKETKPTLEKLRYYKKVVITNTPKECTIQILEKFNIKKYFEFVMTSDDVSLSKPNPEIVLKACKRLNVEPKDIVLVGDTESDVKAGRAAGCKVIGIKVKADYTIKNISELTNLII